MKYKFTLKQARNYAGLTVYELANILNVTPQTICNWEAGKSNPRTDMIDSFAKATGVKKEDIIFFAQKVN